MGFRWFFGAHEKRVLDYGLFHTDTRMRTDPSRGHLR